MFSFESSLSNSSRIVAPGGIPIRVGSKSSVADLVVLQIGILSGVARNVFPVLGIGMLIGAVVFALIAAIPVLFAAVVGTATSLTIGALGQWSRWLKLKVALWYGHRSLPELVRKAAFGADLGTFVGLLNKPPGCLVLEGISSELAAQASKLSGRLAAETGQTLLRATMVVDSDVFAVKTVVPEALSNVALAHSLYYQAPAVGNSIGQLVAGSAGTELTRMMAASKLKGLFSLPGNWNTLSLPNCSSLMAPVMPKKSASTKPPVAGDSAPPGADSSDRGAGTERV